MTAMEYKIPFEKIQKDFDLCVVRCTELPQFGSATAQVIPGRLYMTLDRSFTVLDTVVIDNLVDANTTLETCDASFDAYGSNLNNLSLFVPDHPFLSTGENIELSFFLTNPRTFIVPDFRKSNAKIQGTNIDRYEQWVFVLKTINYGQ